MPLKERIVQAPGKDKEKVGRAMMCWIVRRARMAGSVRKSSRKEIYHEEHEGHEVKRVPARLCFSELLRVLRGLRGESGPVLLCRSRDGHPWMKEIISQKTCTTKLTKARGVPFKFGRDAFLRALRALRGESGSGLL